jgi:hypothetical protein
MRTGASRTGSARRAGLTVGGALLLAAATACGSAARPAPAATTRTALSAGDRNWLGQVHQANLAGIQATAAGGAVCGQGLIYATLML